MFQGMGVGVGGAPNTGMGPQAVQQPGTWKLIPEYASPVPSPSSGWRKIQTKLLRCFITLNYGEFYERKSMYLMST